VVELDATEIRIMGSKNALLQTLVTAGSAKTAGFGAQFYIEVVHPARFERVTFAFGGQRSSPLL
jgi:hypothetical protein